MNNSGSLQRHISPLGAWAFAVGSAVGWGSLMATAGNYLAQAGPAGSVIGMLAGTLIMLVIAWNYSYLIRCYPESGGAYAYAWEILGYEYGFIAAWFLTITYLAILWANATSLPLFGRIFLGNAFAFGKLYTLFGYDVYLGEVLLTVAALVLIGLLCMWGARLADKIMICLAVLFVLCILICTVSCLTGNTQSIDPGFIPDTSALTQIVRTAVISSWAFIGFESISHATEEFDFDRSRITKVLIAAAVTTMLLYVCVVLLSVTAYPSSYDSWLSYIGDLGNQEGLAALPAFYAADHYMGTAGVVILMLALLALVITSLIGMISAVSRLFYVLARDRLLPQQFAEINGKGIPAKAVLLVVVISLLIPFVGRTAIVWTVDVTCIGATIIYGLVCICTARLAKDMENRRERWAGMIGLLLMILFGAYLLLPNLIMQGSLAKETYFLFIVWSVLGFLFFHSILRRDEEKRFGRSMVVWVVVLVLVLLIALIWMRQTMIDTSQTLQNNIQEYYMQQGADPGSMSDMEYIRRQITLEQSHDARTMVIAVGLFLFALFVMLSNHSFMEKRSRESEMLANIDPMTGVKSKHAFLTKEREINARIDDGSVKDFALAVCDVNGLKKVNDTLGHKAGDEYIRESCRMICDIFKHSPVYRVGGDEFAVIISDRDYAIRKELMIALHDRSVDHINEGGAVISGGMSEYMKDDMAFHDVFQRADDRMYTEKKLLKSLGAVTRDENGEESELLDVINEEPSILNVRKHILIVEDEEVNQRMLGFMLQDSHELLYAGDGLEALEMIRAYKDDLAIVLLDLQMPNMNGKEVLRILNEDDELNGIPIVVLTADQSAEVECLKLGAIDFIPKPYPTPEIVRARVERCIELSEDRSIIQSTERDSLTKLYNIDYFMRYVKLYDQHYEDMPMDAIVVDINGFHMINERFGKQYGDDVLRLVGERIRRICRKAGGVCCRRGKDSFLIYCPHMEDYGALLESASEGLEEYDVTADRVRLRLGVYPEVDKKLEIDTRFEYARIACTNVRGNYLNPVGFYDRGMHEKELMKARLLDEFRPALEREDFKVYFQPKFDIRSDQPLLTSAEALVRWTHPELGIISPGLFIPMLEENGLILELDRYVWRRTAEHIRDWKDRMGVAVPISVNVSRIDIMIPDINDILQEILDENGISTRDLLLEITESSYIGDSDHVISAVTGLREMGFRIEMDDFGTGYSSLGMLTRLPIDVLKLDMSFVRSAFGEVRDVRMIKMIMEIAEYLEVPIVAEGVETEEQYLTLKEMGCDIIQGYYFSKPLPPEEFDRFLEEASGDLKKKENVIPEHDYETEETR